MAGKNFPNRKIELADLEVQYVDPNSLSEDPKHPRKIDEAHVDGINASIDMAGMVVPILATYPQRVIIAGVATWRANKKRGATRVPVIFLSQLSRKQEVALRIAHNRLCERGKWNAELLIENIEILLDGEVDFELTITGVDDPEIDVFMLGGKDAIKAAEIDSRDNPEIVELDDLPLQPVSRLGDIFIIGDHIVACGDAREEELLRSILGNRKVDAGITDPPFNKKGKDIGGLGKNGPRDFVLGSGELQADEFQTLIADAAANVERFCRPGAYNFYCTAYYAMLDMMKAFERVYPELNHMCIWTKTNGGMGSPWRNAWEGILVYRKRGGRVQNNVQLGRHGRNRTDVFRHAGVNVFRRGRMEELNSHPTCKPVGLLKNLILDITPIRGVVLDVFLGSGSTIVAANAAKRVGVGVELDPKYVDVAVQRIANAVGLPAIHSSGLTFEELKSEREAAQ